jgi:hypothetical protein
MIRVNSPKDYWTLERCKEDAFKYKTKTEWKEKSSAIYAAAHKKGWIEECCVHMIVLRQRWTLEKCKEDALKYFIIAFEINPALNGVDSKIKRLSTK